MLTETNVYYSFFSFEVLDEQIWYVRLFFNFFIIRTLLTFHLLFLGLATNFEADAEFEGIYLRNIFFDFFLNEMPTNISIFFFISLQISGVLPRQDFK